MRAECRGNAGRETPHRAGDHRADDHKAGDRTEGAGSAAVEAQPLHPAPARLPGAGPHTLQGAGAMMKSDASSQCLPRHCSTRQVRAPQWTLGNQMPP